jgi:hypothetical protein
MIDLEHKFCLLGKDVSISEGAVITGYASLFGAKDHSGDIVEAGAYKASLTKMSAQKRSIKMLWQHDPSQPIGVWDEVREDQKGLWVKGRILTDIAKGREAAALIAAGAIDGLSIGYRTLKAHKGAKGLRHLDEVELWEVSLVTFPMLPDARVGGKGEDPMAHHLRELASVFETARLTFPEL